MAPLRFHTADYAVFAATLVFSMIIGIYHALGGKQSTTKEYLLANRGMMSIPVTLSLLASFMSGVTILGVPSEIYTHGVQYMLSPVSDFITFPVVALIFVPVLYKLELTSSYEYLERRFSFGVRMLGMSLFILYTLLYMAIATYAPSLALESVTGLPAWVSILSLGIVCTFYTTIGGLKAVIWNDVFQAIVMIGGLVTVVVVGTVKVGSPSRVVQLLKENNRTNISFSLDPTERTTVWGLIIGGAFALLPLWSVNQTAVQRYSSLKSVKDAQRSVWVAFPLIIFSVTLCTISGSVIFAYYHGCDPKSLNQITSSDQILPYFVVDVIGHLHGLPGVFLACLFSGTLSTLSSGLNSMAAVVLQDVVKPLSASRGVTFSEENLTKLSKMFAALFGLLAIGMSFLAGSLGTIVHSFYQISGVTGGPVVAVFSMGMLTRRANKKGVFVGLLCGMFFGFFVSVGARIHKPPISAPGVSVERCLGPNATSLTNGTTTTKEYTGLSVYRLSPFWYSFYCYLITFTVGLLVSFIWKDENQRVDERLLVQWKRLIPARFGGVSDSSDEAIEKMTLNDRTGADKRVADENNESKKEDSLVVANSVPFMETKADV